LVTATGEGDLVTTVVGLEPDLAPLYAALGEAAWSVVDPVVLELCRLRMATLLGCEFDKHHRTESAISAGLDEAKIGELSAWPTSERFGPRDRACLAFCEQFVIDVAGMSDDLAVAVAEQLGPQAFRNFVAALLVVEQRQRLRLTWEHLLAPRTER
jgi:alkylhydroperoxidase family enzyme